MTKSLAIAATILVCSGAANAQLVPAATDFINHVRWTVRHGLNQQTVTDVIEARSGYLWVSTYGGLARFDGVRFRTFELDNTSQLGTNKLVSLFEDSRDRLWIGTNGYGAVRYYEGEFRRFANGAPRDDIQDFVQDRSGTVWAAGRGISKFIETESEAYFEPVNQPAWIADTHVPDLVIRNDGQLWAASERGILRSTNGAFEVVLQSEFARHTRAMVVDAENRLWLASRHGIGYLEDGQIHVVRTHDEYVFSANLDASGRVLVGTSSGLYRLSADVDDVQLEKISLPQKDDSLQSGVTALHLDRTGDIWVGTNTFGLIRISEVPFSQFEDPRGLPQGSVSTVVTDPRNGVWLQGDSGWIAWRDNSRIISMTGHAGWPGHENMRLLGVSSSGDLWLRTADSLLQVRGSIETGFSSDQYPYQVAQAFLEDADGHLWFGTNGALLEFHDGVFHRRKVGELAEPLLPRLLDAEGAVWFTAPGVLGYVVASDDAFQYQLLGHGVDWLDSEARSLHQDSSGTVWLSTYGQGLIRIRDGQLARVGRQQGLTELSLGGILEDHAQRLWVNSNRGVLVLPIEQLNATLDRTGYNIVPRFLGSPETNGPTAAKDATGRMWFPTVRGIIVADPARLQPSLRPPKLHIEQIVAGNTVIGANPAAVIPAGTKDLVIRYTGIWLRHPEQVQFRYRMLGYNEDWVPAGSRREAFFTKVPPGEYTFEVAAATGNEEWTSVRLPIAVEAHVYQTIWFKFAVALTIALLLFALHLFRVRSIERYAQQLHSEIENRKKAEHDRERMELSLMRSMRLESVGRLAGGIAHDFNNVLTAILGHADQARTEAGTSNPDLNEQIAGVIECGERAASLTSQLLAFSRQQVLHPQTISPNRVIEGLRPMLTQLLPDNVLLTWRPEKALPDTRVDPGQLEQVVMNLVLNARDAMPDGGEIVIETRSVDHAGHHNTGPATGQHIEISVTDDGNGMEADVASRVFDPFFTTKNAGQGTGLGLASVHGIVLQSGGHIEVDSQPSLGTVFRVYFPALHTHSAATDIDPGSGPAEPLQLTGTGHILLCEDNDSIRPLLRRTLADNGYTVLETSHPDDALALVQNGQHVELLITDVILPGMNGRELATAIRHQMPDTRVIFISGYTDEILDQSSDDGAAFLQKPFRPSELLRLVHDILNRSEGRLNADQDEVEPHFGQ